MENIKDLKLIIGPLDSTQQIEVSLWCDKNSIDSNKFQRPSGNVVDAPYISFNYEATSQGNYFKGDDFEDYERITYQQWYDRFIKKCKVLPYRWCIKRTPETWKEITDYLNDTYDRSYCYNNPRFPWVTNNAKHNESESDKPVDAVEISFEDFEELVLNLNVKQNKEEVMNTKQEFTVEGTEVLKKAFIEEVGVRAYNTTSHKENLYPGIEGGEKFLGGWDTHKAPTHFILPQDWDKAVIAAKEYFKDEIKSVQTKTLVVGNQKIKVIISKDKIEAEGKKISIKLLDEALDIMNQEDWKWDNNTTSWDITFPSVKIGCTTLSLDEVKLIKLTYEEFND